MAVRGIGYFDTKGNYFRAPDDATLSDLAALLGKIGEGDSLAPGIAKIMLQKRREIEHIFADHDRMVTAVGAQASDVSEVPRIGPKLVTDVMTGIATRVYQDDAQSA
jgi:hypothetical protein